MQTYSIVLACLAAPAAAQFSLDNSGIPSGPGINSSSENVDLADVDLDGDWDAAFADGGDDGNDQNRLWVNLGGLQGGVLGDFVDETAARLPQAQDDSRDIEFADVDADGDPDLYVANTAQITNQGPRWWINQGGEQGGALGFYVDDTANRWIGLGGPGSSLAPALVLNDTFIDWSGDGDFADLDNDGDLDLIHTSYSGAFGGVVPTRLFLNDGEGYFEELNPSGFQLSSTALLNGDPALWAEGRQQHGTTDTTGTFADVAISVTDVEVGDLDGDFDLELLFTSFQGDPRAFSNRLEENGGGQLTFRDVTSATYPPGYATGSGFWDHALGDLDGDFDLDLVTAGWGSPFFGDRSFANDGSGVFALLQDLPTSANETLGTDLFDHDGDGDLDLFLAEYSGGDLLYGNDGTGQLTVVQNLGQAGSTLDADAADLDGDGVFDLLTAEDNFGVNNRYWGSGPADSIPPAIAALENDGDRTASAVDAAVRAAVFDNGPVQVTWYQPTALEFAVGGVVLGQRAMTSSRGQIFRGELPGNLVGAVTYRVRAEDDAQNVGVSADATFTATFAGGAAQSFGQGAAGTGGQPTLQAASVPFAGTTLYLTSTGFAPGATRFVYLTDAALAAPLVLPSITTVNVAGNVLALVSGPVAADGTAVTALPIGPGVPPGIEVFVQAFGTDGAGGNLVSSTAGLALVTQ